MTGALLLLAGAAAVAGVLTGAVRRYALARSILDRPNERSLHDTPVPRGGGVAIVTTFAAGLALLAALGAVPRNVAIALAGGLAVALVGWLDDRSGGVPAPIRLAVHVAAVSWCLYWIGGLHSVWLGSVRVEPGIPGAALALVGMAWWINLYNFMDGIDGLAGGQALSVCVLAALLMGGTGALLQPALLLAGAAAGFLWWNWTPARVFMGDAGSGFLGFCFAAFALASEAAGSLPLVLWILLSGVFLFDSTVTLLRRMWRGETWYAPHRTHAYQRLVAAGLTHAQVTAGIVVTNVVLALIALHVLRSGRLLPGALAATALLLVAYLLVERVAPMRARPAAADAAADTGARAATRSRGGAHAVRARRGSGNGGA